MGMAMVMFGLWLLIEYACCLKLMVFYGCREREGNQITHGKDGIREILLVLSLIV
jgi:hypothetical protein